MNVKELTHSQQQQQGPKTHKKKPTIREEQCSVPPKVSSLQILGLEWSQVQDTLPANQQAHVKQPETS